MGPFRNGVECKERKETWRVFEFENLVEPFGKGVECKERKETWQFLSLKSQWGRSGTAFCAKNNGKKSWEFLNLNLSGAFQEASVLSEKTSKEVMSWTVAASQFGK